MLSAYILVAFIISAINAQSVLLPRQDVSRPKSLAVDYVLPDNIVPSLYRLELEPNFDSNTFNGSVLISISVKSTTNIVVLHTNQLDVDASSIRLLDTSGSSINSVSETSYSNDDRHFYTVIFEEDLVEGNEYVLVIDSFVGVLNSDNAGFYLAQYQNEAGEVRKLATTQFEPTSARRAFPCFDEPALKAEFEVTIIRPGDYHSISNTPLESTVEISDGRFQDKFERTVRMSTYLVAFIVSDFAYVAEANQRVFAKPVSIESGGGIFPLTTGISVLAAISEYLNVSYSLSKMDQVELPSGYFSAGAMENWGLVTYRDTYLIDADETLTAEIIAHEFGHQWFGNLVSPAWWTYIWLNEGFATYFEYYAASIVYDDIDFLYRIVTRTSQYAMAREGRSSTRPMNEEAGSPSDISSLFDVIAYDKSGSVVRMAVGILSESVFKRGLNIYLNNRQFDVAEPADLYSAWQEALDEADLNRLPEGEDVASVMTTWDSNAGYPLLSVSRNSDGSVSLSQRKFLTNNPNNGDETIWYIPISYTTKSNPNFLDHSPRVWLTSRSATFDLEDLEDDDWLILNLQTTGYYRVNYDDDDWYRIIDVLNEDLEAIDRINRAQLIDDSYELALAGVIDYDIAFSLAGYTRLETDYFAMQSLINALNLLDGYLSNTEIYGKFKMFVLNKFEENMKRTSKYRNDNDSYFAKLNRNNILSTLCKYGSVYCEQYAVEELRQLQRDGNKLKITKTQSPLICGALRNSNLSDLERVFRKYREEKDATLRKELLNILTCTQNEEALNRLLGIIFESKRTNLKSAERMELLDSIYNSGSFGIVRTFNYIIYNWLDISKIFTQSELSSIMTKLATKLSRTEELDELKLLAEKVNIDAIFTEAIQMVEKNIDLVKNRLPSISAWLNKHY